MSPENNIRTLDPLKEQLWEAWTASHPGGSFFHSSHWARVLQTTYGHELHYLVEMDGEKPRVMLPILEVNSSWKGRRGVALPFSDECGLLCFGDATGHAIIQRAREIGEGRGWKYFELRGDVPSDTRAMQSASFVGHEIDLTVGVDNLFGGFESSVRRAIRKAENTGVTVRVLDTLDATKTFFALHCKTRRKHGVPPQPFSFFANIWKHVLQRGSGFIMMAEHQGRAIAAAIFVHHGQTSLYKFGASEEASLHLRANDMIMWEAIKWYAARCYTTFSMGRTTPRDEGLRRFKRGFGAREKIINYFRYDLSGKTFVSVRGEETAGLSKLFKLTPMPVLRMIGRTVYPHLD